MEEQSLQKVTVSGATLSALIHRVSSAAGDTDGLLFGSVSHMPPSSLSDDDSSAPSTASSATLVATVTGFLSSSASPSFYDSSGQLLPFHPLFHSSHHHHHLLGWFSARRCSPLRPSLREYSVSQSLCAASQFFLPVDNSSLTFPPSVFLLLATPITEYHNQREIHTHEYRAYQFRPSSYTFDPQSFDIINIGPAFRGHYCLFCPKSQLPYLSCDLRGSPGKDDRKKEREKLSDMKKVLKEQKELDLYAECYQILNLKNLLGSDAAKYTAGVEELYEKMLAKLDSLARLVESSSARVLEQENHNMKLRYKVAGFE